jgi:hypothetical protein
MAMIWACLCLGHVLQRGTVPPLQSTASRLGRSPVCDAKRIIYGDAARAALISGVDKVVRVFEVISEAELANMQTPSPPPPRAER